MSSIDGLPAKNQSGAAITPRGTPRDTPRAPPLPALTGLRFVAGFQVLVFHCAQWQTWPVPEIARNVAGAGYVAVSLFFILSGFILTYVHGSAGGGPIERGEFYVTRFARIYPVYALGLLMTAPFFIGHTLRERGIGQVALEGTAVATLVQAHFPSLATAWNPPAWSLSAEAFFYLLFPFLAPRIVKCRPRAAIGIGVASYLACLAVPLAYLALGPDGPGRTTYGTESLWIDAVRYSPLARLPEFVIGIALGRVWLDPRARGWFAEWGSTASIAATAGVLAVLALGDRVPYPLLHNGLLAPLFVVLIAALAAGRGPVVRVLSTRSLLALGEASYALYILHVPLLMWAHKVFGATGAAFDGAAARGLIMAAAIGASLTCNRYFEVPMRRVVREAWKRGHGGECALEREESRSFAIGRVKRS
jgi:peptidoglycan/LPS O-acetylase OafA/YrhL